MEIVGLSARDFAVSLVAIAILAGSVTFVCAMIAARVWFTHKRKYLKSLKADFSSDN